MPDAGLRIVFAGTPVFARLALERLLASRHSVLAVLTQPDRPAGRGQKQLASPVKQAAQAAGVPVLQPLSLRVRGEAELLAEPARRAASEAAADAHQLLTALAPDVMVVAAYGLILPPSVLALPALGCLNIHASLLPRWRGAAPIVRAIEAGDRETGVGIMQMEAGLDTGPVCLERRTLISPADTAATLHDRLAELGAEAIVTVLDQWAEARVDPLIRPPAFVPQPEAGVTYARKIDKAEARIHWQAPASQVSAQIRAFDPAPGAQAEFSRQAGQGAGEALRVFDPEVLAPLGGDPAAAGRVLAVGPAGIEIGCGSGRIRVSTLQRAGGRRLAAAEFTRGFPIVAGDRFGS